MRSKSVLFAAAAALAFAADLALGEGFVPGHVFVSDAPFKYCTMQADYGWDRIWEIDPETGEAHVFANLMGSECGFITGLAFTPDGCRLRASQNLSSRILEFAPDGSWTVALDFNDGIFGPEGYNNLAYDAEGNFYVVNCVGNILKFPKDGGPGVVFADRDDGVGGCGSITFTADGDLYFGDKAPDAHVVRITPDGNGMFFENYHDIAQPLTLTADASGHLYVGLVGVGAGIYRFTASDPTSRERLPLNSLLGAQYAMTMAPDARKIFAVSGGINTLHSIDVVNGDVQTVAQFPGNEAGLGIAIAPVAPGDFDRDGDVDFDDHQMWIGCTIGPGSPTSAVECRRVDTDGDRDVDLADWAALQRGFGAEAVCPND